MRIFWAETVPRLQRMIRAESTYHEGKRERGRAGRIQNRTLIKLAGSQSQVVNSQPLKQDIFAPEGYGPDLGHAQISFISAFSNARKARACWNALFLDQISESSSMFRCSMLVCALTFCRFCLQESPRKVSSWCEKEILTCIYRCFWRENLPRVCFRVVPLLNLEVRCHDQVWKSPWKFWAHYIAHKTECQAYSCSTCKWISSTLCPVPVVLRLHQGAGSKEYDTAPHWRARLPSRHFAISAACAGIVFGLSPRHQDRVIERILQLGCRWWKLLRSLRGALKFLLIQLNCLRQENANARDRKGHLQVLLGMWAVVNFNFLHCFCSRIFLNARLLASGMDTKCRKVVWR